MSDGRHNMLKPVVLALLLFSPACLAQSGQSNLAREGKLKPGTRRGWRA